MSGEKMGSHMSISVSGGAWSAVAAVTKTRGYFADTTPRHFRDRKTLDTRNFRYKGTPGGRF